MDKTEQSSRRFAWLIVGTVTAVFIVIALALYIVFGSAAPEEGSANSTGQANTSEASVTSADEAKQNLATLEASIEQSKDAQEAAEAALDDSKNRVKLGD